MRSRDAIEAWLVGNVTFPTSNALFNRRRILKNLRDLTISERWSSEQHDNVKFLRLRSLLAYAYEHIPYYKEKFNKVGLVPSDIKKIEDLSRLPPVIRQDVIEHHHQMVDCRFLNSALVADKAGRPTGAPMPFAILRKDRVLRNTSSGSTGAPTIFYEDGSRTALNWTHELRLRSWFGIAPGSREARMARISTDYRPKSVDLIMRRVLWNQLILPGVNLGPEDYRISYEKLRKFRPVVLWGFTSALAGFAQYLRDAGIDPEPVSPKLIISWAAPLYDHEEKVLKDVFRCPVTNIYGAREVGHIAGRCPFGTFHINEEFLFLEVDGASRSASDATGELLVTTLDTTIMPFIRYRTGDIGRISRRPCACGRTLQSIDDLLGRTGEIFKTRDGRMISPNFWCRTFMNPKLGGKVLRFQVIYKKDDEMEIRIVRGRGYDQDTESSLLDFLGKNFSGSMRTSLSYVEEIKPQISGKYQMVINETV